LASGSISEISNPPGTTSTQTCVLNGVPSSIVVDPAGAFAYTIVNENSLCSGSSTGIAALKINSDGTVVPTGSLVAFNAGTVSGIANPVPVVPYALVMDPAGKFLFVADRAIPQGAMTIPGSVSVFTISNGTATEVAGSPFYPTNPAVPLAQESMDIIAVAPTPTVFPKTGVNGVQNSVCSDAGNTPPSTQFLYAADSLGNQVLEFQVDMSSGVLGYPGGASAARTFPADQVPAGVAVDPCNRFVYVSNLKTNKISGYTMCSGALTQSQLCPVTPDGSLMQIAGSPFSLAGSANGPGPMVVDPFGNYVYVLDTLSGGVSTLKISPISGSLTANATVAATGVNPTAIAVRGDDNWLFVANNGSSPATISQFTITPATGVLSPLPTISTDNFPWGVAVK
jgi:DNA-binding beta-propeller fold protein YncE